jgi:dolichol-phosphate mannosyltransferase
MERPSAQISIVVPCFNEEAAFPALRNRLTALADSLANAYDIDLICIDDGSLDMTWELIREFASCDPRVRGVSLSRNFGHQLALTCGYDLARGDAVVSIDADLQDPPELIPQMIDCWRSGADVVYAVRRRREGESAFKLATASLFYRLMRFMGVRRLKLDSGDFRLLSRRAIHALNSMREAHRFVRGMVGWIGFKEAVVEYERAARVAGQTKYPVRKMLLLAMDAAVSFSGAPLRIAYVVAFSGSLIILSYLGYVIVRVLVFQSALVPGWTSLLLTVMGFGALNLVCLGIVGEYVGRIYDQSKNRPLYVLGDACGDARSHPTAVDKASLRSNPV